MPRLRLRRGSPPRIKDGEENLCCTEPPSSHLFQSETSLSPHVHSGEQETCLSLGTPSFPLNRPRVQGAVQLQMWVGRGLEGLTCPPVVLPLSLPPDCDLHTCICL